MKTFYMNNQRIIHFMIILIILLIAFSFSNTYYTSILSKAIIFTIFAISLDLAWGYGGILSLGHSVFFGLGAYSYSIIALNGSFNGSIILAVCLGILIPIFFAMLISGFLFYSKSSLFYIGIVTLSLAVLFEQFALQLSEITGGQNGLTNVPSYPFSSNMTFIFLLIMLILIFAVVYTITNSDMGRLIVSTRDNEERTIFLGYNTSFVKAIVFTISGGIAGLAGVLYAPFDQFVSPTLISFALATQVVVWVAIGGRGKIIGAVFGALLINILTPIFNDSFPYFWQIFLGLMFIIAVIFLPKGLYSLFSRERSAEVNYKIERSNNTLLEKENGNEVLTIENAEISFGSLSILKGIDLTLNRGELMCVVGPNGAGKSTLINGITNKYPISEGNIYFQSNSIKRSPSQKIVKSGVARTFQATNIVSTLTVAENLKLASDKGKLPSIIKRSNTILLSDIAIELLKQSGLDNKLNELAGQLSHGDQQSLELCMVLALEPEILLLDEPTAGLTLEERKNIGEMLKVLAHERGISLLIIEHDLDFVKSIADRVTVLYDGKIALDGSVNNVTESELVKEIYLGVKAE